MGIIRLRHWTKKYSESTSENKTDDVSTMQNMSISGERSVFLRASENFSEKSFVLYPPHMGHSWVTGSRG